MQAKNAFPVMNTGVSVDFEYETVTIFVLEQYNYKDFVTIEKDDIVLDCGGHCGDTAIWALQKGAAKIYVFEPNPVIIPRLKANVKDFEEQGSVIVLPYALGAEDATVSFASDLGAASRVDTSGGEGSVSVQQVKLDDWCEEHNVIPDFIKMDIEGAEVDSIKGASQIIKKYKPRLAICLYHRPSDMWVIPALLKEICPEYRFWCRKNAMDYEFVLYCHV